MSIHRIILLSISILLLNIAASAQSKGYNIKVKVDKAPDKQLTLVTYYGTSNKIIDTAFVNKKGEYIFKGDKPLVGGMYLIVFENKHYFELIIDKDQDFSLHTSMDDLVKNMKVKGSKDNSDFYALMNYMGDLNKKRIPLDKELKDSTTTEARKKEIKEELKAIGKEADDYRIKYMEENPQALFTIILKASKEPEIPKVLPKNEDGTDDSTYIYKYYRAHFFDNFDFADERLLHTRFYAQKIKKYWTKVIPQHPDTLSAEAIRIIELAKPNKETYKFNIWYFTYAAETSNIMGMDAVFVTLGKKYYLTGEAYWVNKTVLKNMTERINTLDRLLIGKTAPNMIMQDTAMVLRSLYDVNANYTLVLFWDPDCGHCKHEIPRLKKWIDENKEKYGIQVFSVCSDTSIVKWKKSIKTFGIEDWVNVDGPRSITPNYHDTYDIISTPTIYLLDDKKKIIAKRLSDEQVHGFIKRDFEQKEKAKKED
ncbi:MAG: hypothetical protein DSY76_05820 [Bacteroidetes bacterium]|nr:MAG: hypothetical protein DSY76_05820 [Bacteroidota bacterium]